MLLLLLLLLLLLSHHLFFCAAFLTFGSVQSTPRAARELIRFHLHAFNSFQNPSGFGIYYGSNSICIAFVTSFLNTPVSPVLSLLFVYTRLSSPRHHRPTRNLSLYSHRLFPRRGVAPAPNIVLSVFFLPLFRASSLRLHLRAQLPREATEFALRSLARRVHATESVVVVPVRHHRFQNRRRCSRLFLLFLVVRFVVADPERVKVRTQNERTNERTNEEVADEINPKEKERFSKILYTCIKKP